MDARHAQDRFGLSPDDVDSGHANPIRPWWSVASLQIGRTLLLASLVYICWRLGVGGIGVHWHFGVILAITSVLCALHFVAGRRAPGETLKLALPAIAICWIGFAYAQTLPLPPRVLSAVAPGTHQVRGELVDNQLSQLVSVSEQATVASRTTLSTVPGLTRREASRYTLGLAAMFCSFVLFNTARSRRVFAFVLLLNAVALACWGIIQQAIDSNHLFPGIPNSVDSSYFSTYIYKNAAGAALLSGVSIATGFIYWIHSGYTPAKEDEENSKRQPRSRSARLRAALAARGNLWIDPFHLGICCALGMLAVGLIVSQSRGACAAACLATIAMLILARRSIRVVDACIGITVLVLTAATFVWLTDLRDTAALTKDRVSVESVTSDERWQHWADGIATATTHLPFGAGIGAYGYAQLAQQSFDSTRWFREAHNQYLETVADAGIVGLALLVALLWIISKMCWTLYRSSDNREAKGWGLIAGSLLIALALQSVFDFVVVIQANMVLFASILGVLLAVYQRECSAHAAREKNERQNVFGLLRSITAPRGFAGRVVYASIVLLMIVAAMLSYRAERGSSLALQSTKLPAEDERPTLDQINTQLGLLNQAIEADPLSAALYQRRSLWHQAKLREQLHRLYAQTGNTVDWKQTRRETVFALFAAMDEPSQQALRGELLADDQFSKSLADACNDIAESLTLNPFVPQAQMSAAFLSPLCKSDPRTWAANCRRLSHSSPELLLANGLMGMLMNDKAIVIDQWHRYFALTQARWEYVLTSARMVLTPKEMVFDLIPQSRSDLLARYVEQVHRTEHTLFSVTLVDESIAAALAGKDRPESERNALLARMYLLSADLDLSRKHWEAALAGDRRNLDYRYHYAKSLLRCRDYQAARKQAVLGQTLEPNSTRFQLLEEKIEADEVRNRARAKSRDAQTYR